MIRCMVKKEKTTVGVGDGRRAQQQAINFNYCGCYHSIAVVGSGNIVCPSSVLLDHFFWKACLLACLHPKKICNKRGRGVVNQEAFRKLMPVGRSVVLSSCYDVVSFFSNNINIRPKNKYCAPCVNKMIKFLIGRRASPPNFYRFVYDGYSSKFIRIGIVGKKINTVCG